MASRGRILWSTGHGAMCAGCRRPKAQCACRKAGAQPVDGVVRVRRETKGRAGKGVTVVLGVPLAGDALAAFATELKKRCGSGGTVKDGTIEIQGDHREAVMAVLRARGWTVKAAGG